MSLTNYFYLDASALAKRYAPEPGSLIMDHFFSTPTADRLLLLNVGSAEVISILVRKRNAGILSGRVFSQAILTFQTEILNAAAIQKLEVDNSLVTDAFPLIINHSINATDALLYCARA